MGGERVWGWVGPLPSSVWAAARRGRASSRSRNRAAAARRTRDNSIRTRERLQCGHVYSKSSLPGNLGSQRHGSLVSSEVDICQHRCQSGARCKAEDQTYTPAPGWGVVSGAGRWQGDGGRAAQCELDTRCEVVTGTRNAMRCIARAHGWQQQCWWRRWRRWRRQ